MGLQAMRWLFAEPFAQIRKEPRAIPRRLDREQSNQRLTDLVSWADPVSRRTREVFANNVTIFLNERLGLFIMQVERRV
jgi:hypothetical protein